MRENTAGPADAPERNAAVKTATTGAEIPDVAVVGAGASGCIAAVSAAMEGAEVLLIDATDRSCRKF